MRKFLIFNRANGQYVHLSPLEESGAKTFFVVKQEQGVASNYELHEVIPRKVGFEMTVNIGG